MRVAALTILALALPLAPQAWSAEDFSVAEKAIFMDDQMGALKPPTTLRYHFRKSGSLEPGFDDEVTLALSALPDGSCCAASGDFLSGERKSRLPEIENPKSNPVTLYFLERDIREMNRLTRGSQNYFRKRIRMAAYQGASVAPARFGYRGRTIDGREITLKPFADDPNRARMERYAEKEYHFLLSDAVPGGVYGIRTLIRDAARPADAAPLLAEDMLIEGADPAR